MTIGSEIPRSSSAAPRLGYGPRLAWVLDSIPLWAVKPIIRIRSNRFYLWPICHPMKFIGHSLHPEHWIGYFHLCADGMNVIPRSWKTAPVASIEPPRYSQAEAA